MTFLAWRRLVPALLAASLILPAPPTWADEDAAAVKPVKLATQIQQKLGLATQPLQAAARAATAPGFARVLDPGPLAQLESDIETAQAAADASVAEAARSRALNAGGGSISTRQLQAAEAQATADQSKLALLRRRVGLEWGEGLARMSPHRLAALVTDIAAGRAALLRIDTPSGEGLAGVRGVELDLGGLGQARATVLGAARNADPHLLSPGLIAEATGSGARSLAVGLTVPVKLAQSGPVQGVIAPRDALVRSKGKTWVYVRTAAETFLRKPVQDGRPEQDGLFVADGLRPGEQVVTHAAAALFAAETNVGEDGGD